MTSIVDMFSSVLITDVNILLFSTAYYKRTFGKVIPIFSLFENASMNQI